MTWPFIGPAQWGVGTSRHGACQSTPLVPWSILVPWFCWTQWLNSLEHTTNSQITSSWQITRLWFPAYRTAFIRSKLRKSASRNSARQWGQWSIADIASANRWLLNRQTTDSKESMFQAFHHGVLCLSNISNTPLHLWQFYPYKAGMENPDTLHC